MISKLISCNIFTFLHSHIRTFAPVVYTEMSRTYSTLALTTVLTNSLTNYIRITEKTRIQIIHLHRGESWKISCDVRSYWLTVFVVTRTNGHHRTTHKKSSVPVLGQNFVYPAQLIVSPLRDIFWWPLDHQLARFQIFCYLSPRLLPLLQRKIKLHPLLPELLSHCHIKSIIPPQVVTIVRNANRRVRIEVSRQ